MPDAPADAGILVQPAAKRFRRSTSDLVREQKLRAQQAAAAGPAPTSEALVPVPEAVQLQQLQFADPISSQVDTQDIRAADSALSFEVAARSRTRQLELAAIQVKQEASKPQEAEPVLTTSEDLAGDLSVKTAMRFATTHRTFRWLRRLPAALRCQAPDATREGPAREAVLEVCKDCFPELMKNPDKAVRWVERMAACLTWYRLDGPVVPSSSRATSGASPEERAAWRRVDEWEEAFRGLEQLLRQGLLPAFVVQAERFSVTVFGEGAGPWRCARTGTTRRPTGGAPCAVLCPSADELRRMLQDNHVSFEVAEICSSGGDAPAGGGRELKGRTSEEALARSQDAGDKAIVATGALPANSLMEDIRSEMRELRRGGEKVVTPDEMGSVTPLSSALWFDGAWRVHALLDVLRQYFLGGPLPSAPQSPARLPRLVAPAAFPHAAVQSAEVLKTQTVQGFPGAPGAPAPEKAQHIAELAGCFFPSQVRRLSELLTVLLPSFSCGLTAEPRLCAGINAFTHLGMRRVETVECECVDVGPSSVPCLKWEFKLAA